MLVYQRVNDPYSPFNGFIQEIWWYNLVEYVDLNLLVLNSLLSIKGGAKELPIVSQPSDSTAMNLGL